MFKVYRNNRVQFKGQTFDTFEAARQQVRKFIRKNVKKLVSPLYEGQTPQWSTCFGMWDKISRNPTNYTNSGFSIKKVA